MASEEDSSSSLTCKGTPVSELRVIDIKRELDERGLSKSGSKTQLTERLKAQLLLEKLQQDAAQSSGDELEGKAPNMALQDDKAGQNEFVRQYLQQQQRNIEIQMEVKKQVEEERKRKSADESSADESNRNENATATPAETEVTSPKKFKDEQSNAPAKEGVRMPRVARKSSRHASKGENGQDEVVTKDHSRSSTPENESIRERTRSGSSSSDCSLPPEKSRRGRRTRQPRGRSSRGARRGGRTKESRSSSPSSSPEEVLPKRKRRSTNSVSSRSRSRSPHAPSPAEIGTRRSSRRAAAAAVRSTPEQTPEVDAEDEKEMVTPEQPNPPPQRKRWTRKWSTQDSQIAKIEESATEVGQTPNPPQNDSANDEKADVSKEKQTCVKIAEDNSGQKITLSADKNEAGDDAQAKDQSAPENKEQPEKNPNSKPAGEESGEKVEKPSEILPASRRDETGDSAKNGQPQQSAVEHSSDVAEVKKVQETKASDNVSEVDIKSEAVVGNQETKPASNRLSRWKSSRAKSHTPPQKEESNSKPENKSSTSEASKSSDATPDQSTTHTETTSQAQQEESATTSLPSLPVESGDAQKGKAEEDVNSQMSGTEAKEQALPQKEALPQKQALPQKEDTSVKLNEKDVKKSDDSDEKEKVSESDNKTADPVKVSSPKVDDAEVESKRDRGRQRTRSGSSSGSSSRSSSSGSKSDDSKSSSSSSRSRSSSSSSSSDGLAMKSKKANAAKKSHTVETSSQKSPGKPEAAAKASDGKGTERSYDMQSSKSPPEPPSQPKVKEKSPPKKVAADDEDGDDDDDEGNETVKETKQSTADAMTVAENKDSPVHTPEVDDGSKKEKLAKKRKWGSKTSKATKVLKKPANMEISSDSLKGLIGDVKLTETVFDMETEVVNTLDYDEQEDDRRDIKVKRTVVQSSPHSEEEEAGEGDGDARQVETRDDDPDEKPTSPVSIPEEPEKKIIKVSASSPKEGKRKVKDTKKVKVKRDISSTDDKENKEKPDEMDASDGGKGKIIATHRASKPVFTQVDDPEPILDKQTSARFPSSTVLRLIGLVRPFTLNQLKELLKRTGELEEELFWINSIKSECLVTYKTQEGAVATRKALHGTKWPSSNPKILDVDFSTLDDVKHRQSGNTGPLPSTQKPKEEVAVRLSDRRDDEERERRQKAREQRDNEREERDKELKDKRDTDKQKRRDADRRVNVREWDRDKIQQLSRSRSRSKGRDEERPSRRSRDRDRERGERKRRDRSRDKDEEKKKEKKQKAEEEPPAKLLDDLFRKTKATPCIYWLPLTEEQAQQRLIQKEEREKERQKRLAAIEERNREEQKKREAARLERQRERQRERSKERNSDRAKDGGRGRESGVKGRNRGRSSGSRSRSQSRSRRRR